MSNVFSALSVSVDGYITGRDPGPGRGLGDSAMLFDWYFDGDTPSGPFDGFRLSESSARVFDAEAGRVGATLAGRNTYDDSGWVTGGTPHPTGRPFFQSLSNHVRLRLVDVVAAPGVTHLHYEVARTQESTHA